MQDLLALQELMGLGAVEVQDLLLLQELVDLGWEAVTLSASGGGAETLGQALETAIARNENL
jgi:hypothetical protein